MILCCKTFKYSTTIVPLRNQFLTFSDDTHAGAILCNSAWTFFRLDFFYTASHWLTPSVCRLNTTGIQSSLIPDQISREYSDHYYTLQSTRHRKFRFYTHNPYEEVILNNTSVLLLEKELALRQFPHDYPQICLVIDPSLAPDVQFRQTSLSNIYHIQCYLRLTPITRTSNPSVFELSPRPKFIELLHFNSGQPPRKALVISCRSG